MNKAVMISIQPKWVALIANGKKTVEVRKTKPKLETPFKVYIYCTRPKTYTTVPIGGRVSNEFVWICNGKVKMTDGAEYLCQDDEYWFLNGKVIGEFVCDYIYELHEYELTPQGEFHIFEKAKLDFLLEQSCLSYGEICDYRKNLPCHKPLYAWKISNLVIYDKPKELSEFCRNGECDKCGWFENGKCYKKSEQSTYNNHRIKRPPQSWCYVEEQQ